MSDGPDDRGSLPALAAALLRLASLLVPAGRRREWLRQWRAELWHARKRGRRAGRGGASPAALALRAAGSVPHAAWEAARGVESLAADLQRAARRIARRPGFAVTSILTLALGVGAATAIFGVVHGVLLEPLPYEHPEELVVVWHEAPGLDGGRLVHTKATWMTYRDEARSLAEFGAWAPGAVTVADGDPERVESVEVTASVFAALRTGVAAGRLFVAADLDPAAAPVVVLSHGYWRRRFGGDPGAIGRSLSIDGVPFEIVGVTADGFRFPADPRFGTGEPGLFLPLRRAAPLEPEPLSFDYLALARLAPGVDREAAEADLAAALARSAERYRWIDPGRLEEWGLRPAVRPLREMVVGDIGGTLWTLFGAVAILLVLACANVANLFLVQAEGRRREIAVRSALGAGVVRLARQFLAESLLLAALGGAVGAWLAWLGTRLLLRMAPAGLPRAGEIGLDPAVLLFAAGVAAAAGVAFGLVPVAVSDRRAPARTLREGGRSGSAGRGRRRVRDLLAVGEVALALVLLTGSGLLLRSFRSLGSVEPGVAAPERVLTFRLSLPRAGLDSDLDAVRRHRRILRRLAAVPGVAEAGAASAMALEGRGNRNGFLAEGVAVEPGTTSPPGRYKAIAGDYFRAAGIPLLAGRTLTWEDRLQARPVGVVSEGLATALWGSAEAALGRRIRHREEDPWREIVGVVGDVRDDGVDREAPWIAYWPLAVEDFLGFERWVRRDLTYAVRGRAADPRTLLPAVREAVWSVDPDLPLADVRTLDAIARDSISRTSFTLVILGIAAAVALILGVIGVYGVVAYATAQRTREIGIRLALGADRGDVQRLVLQQGSLLAVAGVALGLAAAAGLSHLLVSLLFGVAPLDGPTYAVAAAGLGGLTLAACWIPARRAARVDPARSLRSG